VHPREVHTLYCVGKNYAEHAREMGAKPEKGEPTIFLKPAASLRAGDALELQLPAWSTLVHHEVELVMLLRPGFDAADPLACVEAYGVGLDLTLRDLQSKAKASGAPWTASKGFPGAALLSVLWPAAGIDPSKLELRLELDGALRQSGTTADMLHPVPSLLLHLAERYGLLGGELIYTGTPAGVGPVQPGARLSCRLSTAGGDVLAQLEVHVAGPGASNLA
jgi:2-keto-4-pentenoate hydratase/2-oxohepta-3-ene-1,7-dioic acid hydratase in catechol pathway